MLLRRRRRKHRRAHKRTLHKVAAKHAAPKKKAPPKPAPPAPKPKPAPKPSPAPKPAPAPVATPPKPVERPVPVFAEPTSVANMERLLWRAGFGPAPGQAEALARLDLQSAVFTLTRPSGAAQLIGPAPHDDD